MAEQMLVYVGTYTRGESEGIYVYRLALPSGALEPVSTASGNDNPAFLTFGPQQRYLYAVSEIGEFEGQPSGAVSAFAISPGTGELAHLNQQPTGGAGPCHLTVDQTGRSLLVANYDGGSVTVLPIGDDGRLGEATDFVQHEGSSVNPERQAEPHAHSITLDPANRYAFAADLGLDQVVIYQFDSAEGKLKPNDPAWAQVKPGAGPRHFAFHPSRRYAYVIDELDNTITAFTYDETRGALEHIHAVGTLPDGFGETSYCADIHVSPSGRFVYGSNRGHDSIVIFAIDEQTGRLTYVDHEPTQGQTPRNFAIDPTGSFLLAANQDSNNIVTFRIDQETGKLASTGHVAEVPTPVCLKMMSI